MKIFILGVCGTFMGGIAQIAREQGHEVSGSDEHIYPPMSDQLQQANITLVQGYEADRLAEADLYLVGNAISRGNPQLERILDEGRPYRSAPQWLYESVLQHRWVLAVAGTHGKTTTTSLLSWIMQQAGLEPGWLIGGVAPGLGVSARLGRAPFFVIEADEYDTAFSDKRSKFVHYHPRTLILNNLEFDHADIFDNLAMIERQFHHLLRLVPSTGLILHPGDDEALKRVLEQGCWSEVFSLQEAELKVSATGFELQGKTYPWPLKLLGDYNRRNAMMALLAARHAGVPLTQGLQALAQFSGVKRRQELLGEINGVRLIDDFAHHPTAIALTLEALKDETPGRLLAVLDPRSNTMKRGDHGLAVMQSLGLADQAYLYDSGQLHWDAQQSATRSGVDCIISTNSETLITALCQTARSGDTIVFMSNGGFERIPQRTLTALQSAAL